MDSKTKALKKKIDSDIKEGVKKLPSKVKKVELDIIRVEDDQMDDNSLDSKYTNPDWISIDPKVKISELIEIYPELMEVLTYEYGLHCVNCFISEFDTLQEGAKIHGIEGKYFTEMVNNLEKIINLTEE